MKNRVNYLRIKTLADVRAERMRIADELDDLEERLEGDYQRIVNMFSVSYVVERVTAKAGKFYTAIEWAMSGYHFLKSLIEKYKSSAADHRDEHEEQEKAAG